MSFPVLDLRKWILKNLKTYFWFVVALLGWLVYLLSYIPFIKLTGIAVHKVTLLTKGVFGGAAAMSVLPVTLLGCLATICMVFTLPMVLRWMLKRLMMVGIMTTGEPPPSMAWVWKVEHHLPRYGLWGLVSFTRSSVLSGLCAGAVMCLTTISYGLPVSVVLMALLMRFVVLVQSIPADLRQENKDNKRRITYPAVMTMTIACAAVMLATNVAHLHLVIGFTGLILLGLYAFAYHKRFGFMGANKGSLSFGLTETLVAILTGLTVCVLLSPWVPAVAYGWTMVGDPLFWLNGVASEFTGLSGAAILLTPFAYSLSVPLNRSGAMIAANIASPSGLLELLASVLMIWGLFQPLVASWLRPDVCRKCKEKLDDHAVAMCQRCFNLVDNHEEQAAEEPSGLRTLRDMPG